MRIAPLAIGLMLAGCTQAQITAATTDVQSAITSACADYNSAAVEASVATGLVASINPALGAAAQVITGTVDAVCNAGDILAPNVATSAPLTLDTAQWIATNTGYLKSISTQAQAIVPIKPSGL